MRNSSVIGRAAAIAAVVLAIVVVGVIVLSSGSTYQVKAIFQNASQIVSGDLVQVAGNPIGTVSDISLTPQGQAELTLQIKSANFEPLRKGTLATIRQASLSGIANRYVDLRLGSGTNPPIPNNGVLPTTATTSAVDFDQLLNTLDTPTRKALQNVIQGSATQYAGQGNAIERAWQYLNPAVVASSVLFHELNRDTHKFTQFIVKSGNLVTDLASRRNDLAGLVQHLSATTSALATQSGTPLAQTIQRLPPFMRLANTTFVNLRTALDVLKPLVDVSKPVAPKLRLLLARLEPLAVNSVPTVRDLSNIISRPGANNDLIDLNVLSPQLANVTVHNVFANGRSRPGAFPISIKAMRGSTPELAIARPYAVDLTGWFEGYTHPGGNDANGSYSRVAPVIGLQSIDNGVASPITGGLDQILGIGGSTGKTPLLVTGQGDRCPGSIERNALWYPESGFPCNPHQVPTGR